jgi:penicillin-binding protein 1C
MKMIAVIKVLALILSTALVEHAGAALPSFAKVKESRTTSEALLLDRHGEVIHEVRIDPWGRRLEWKALGEISPALKEAVIQSEDRRFYRHRGVDWRALGYAFVSNPVSSSRRGASTITMQLASLLERRRPSAARRDWREKWRQIQSARELERSWSKDEILEAYLNLISFRGELQGVAAAARGLLGKEPHGLDESDAWMLASLIRAPNAPPGKVAARACALGRSLRASADCKSVEAGVAAALAPRLAIKARANLAPHVAERLLGSIPMTASGARSATTTLDGKLQRFASEVLREQLLALKAQNVHDGAVLVVDNTTGEILAYVGNGGELASARFVDGVRAPRQAGSTLKPFLYGLAFEQRLLTPASLLDDSAMDISDGRGIYRPRNYDERYQGLVTARVALASSLNIPAVKTLALVGTEPFLRRLRDLGFAGVRGDEEYYGPSLALGSADVTLWQLVSAYRGLANGGRRSEIGFVPGQNPAFQRVLSEESAFLISSILSDRESRSVTFGFEGPLATRFWSAVKTGTSKEMRDNWCIGYSSKYTVGVWIGNFSGAPMWNVSGMSGAAPIWLDVMNWLHKNEPSSAPKVPAGVTDKAMENPPQRGRRAEWFLKGTEPTAQAVAAKPLQHKIIYPADGTIMALDPDIPSARQKVFFEAQPQDKQLRWTLNGVTIGTAANATSWSPTTGSHSLALVDSENRVVDRIAFSVRGRVEDLKQEANVSEGALPR